MSLAPPPEPTAVPAREPAARSGVRHRKIRFREFLAMSEAGVFPPDERLELLDGEICTVAAAGHRHIVVTKETCDAINDQVRHACFVVSQSNLELSDWSGPEPDVAVFRGPKSQYEERIATHADALLLVEVSHSTLADDLERKVPLYAAAGIPEVWVLDLVDDLLRRFADPAQGAYRTVERHAPDATVACGAVAGLTLRLADVNARSGS